MYIPIEGYTDSQKAELKSQAEAQFATYTSLDCCSLTYNESANYFTITLEVKNVDKPEAYSELYSAGLTSANTPLSMKMTENDLLASEGFIKK